MSKLIDFLKINQVYTMLTIENKIPFANTRCCSFCSKPGHDIRNCNDIHNEDLSKKETQESKTREKLLKKIKIANEINDIMTLSINLKLR
jgi:hypothetical protein